MLFIIVCLLFSSSRSLLNISCIFSILFLRFWIIFTIITLILFQVDCLPGIHPPFSCDYAFLESFDFSFHGWRKDNIEDISLGRNYFSSSVFVSSLFQERHSVQSSGASPLQVNTATASPLHVLVTHSLWWSPWPPTPEPRPIGAALVAEAGQDHRWWECGHCPECGHTLAAMQAEAIQNRPINICFF